MGARTRVVYRDPKPAGKRTRLVNGTVIFADEWDYLPGYSRCQDVVDGTRNAHDLQIDHWDIIIPENDFGKVKINGSDIEDGWGRSFENWVPEYVQSISPSHLPIFPKWANTFAHIASQTNPGRDDSGLIVDLAEIGEIPKLLKWAGSNIWKKGANAYLSYHFGIKPLVQDLLNVLDVHKRAHERRLELEALYKGGGIKKKVHLQTDAADDDKFIVGDSKAGVLICYNEHRRTELEQWGSIHWYPDPAFPPPMTSSEYHDKAMRLALGFDFAATTNDIVEYGATAWELIPWSWMIDWYGSLGDYLGAYRNNVPAKADSICTMTQRTTTYLWVPDRASSWPDATFGTLAGTYVTKERQTGVPAITAGLPYLSASHLNVLAALAVLRIPRSSRYK